MNQCTSPGGVVPVTTARRSVPRYARRSCFRLPAAVALYIFALLSASASLVQAGEADVVAVKPRHGGGDMWSFDVTVRHDDTGWDHYADKWDVVALDGTVLGTRVLLHPHETEQPFTRSLSGVQVPAGTTSVILRAHDSVHGYGGAEMRIELTK